MHVWARGKPDNRFHHAIVTPQLKLISFNKNTENLKLYRYRNL